MQQLRRIPIEPRPRPIIRTRMNNSGRKRSNII
jgi:hypothetical protein